MNYYAGDEDHDHEKAARHWALPMWRGWVRASDESGQELIIRALTRIQNGAGPQKLVFRIGEHDAVLYYQGNVSMGKRPFFPVFVHSPDDFWGAVRNVSGMLAASYMTVVILAEV